MIANIQKEVVEMGFLEKQTWYLIWIPVLFTILFVYSMAEMSSLDTEEFTGEIIDKYIDGNSRRYFVLENVTDEGSILKVETKVNLDLYYDNDIGDVATINRKVENDDAYNTWLSYSLLSVSGIFLSLTFCTYMDSRFYHRRIQKDEKGD